MAKVILNKYYEVFDESKDNELIDTHQSLNSAIDHAQTNKNFRVDLIIELDDEDGESALVSGDNLYTMQIYPALVEYDNFETNIKLN